MSELRQIMERILRRHAGIDEIKADMKDDYAQARSAGFDKTALGQAIREIRNRDKNESAAAVQRQAEVDLYIAEFDAAAHAYARSASIMPTHEVQ